MTHWDSVYTMTGEPSMYYNTNKRGYIMRARLEVTGGKGSLPM
jgi:hypothetical protein